MTDEINAASETPSFLDVPAKEKLEESERESIFADLYQRHFTRLIGDLRLAFGSGPPEPEDVAQRAFEKLNSYQDINNIRNLEGFVWVCARNIILSEKRSEQVRQKNQDEVERRLTGGKCNEFDPERITIAKEKLATVMATLRRMPERRRRIFMLNRVDGLTLEAAGRQCGVGRSAAVRHIALAAAMIAEALEVDGDGCDEENE